MSALHTPAQLATRFRQLCTGGNWTDVNIRDTLAGITRKQALQRPGQGNSIAALTFHIHYFVAAQLRVLQGGPLDAHDKYSWDLPPLQETADWTALQQQLLSAGEAWAAQVEQLPESRLAEAFVLEKYGSYFHNLLGLIEHTHYHLGQIKLLKNMLQSQLL